MCKEGRNTRKARIDKIVGENIRTERVARQMSREQLSEMLGITVSHMGLMERGERGTTLVTLEKLCDIFNMPKENFFVEPGGSSSSREVDNDKHKANQDAICILAKTLNEKEAEIVIFLMNSLLSMRYTSNTDDA